LRDALGMPGMRVLQFAWGGYMPSSVHLPHNYTTNSIVYTGTHDNNTTKGWFKNDADHSVREQVKQYTGIDVQEANIHEVFWRLAYASVADIAIVPIQDVLAMDEHARINTPGKPYGNWHWRMPQGVLNYWVEHHLLTWAELYNR
jgi:4-alpha-glucanotransferase